MAKKKFGLVSHSHRQLTYNL